MVAPRALFLALDLSDRPILAGAMRRQPLPDDMVTLIKIAADDAEACDAAERATGRPRAQIREAAALFLQQVLFAPEADHYRVLGLSERASRQDLREHMRWLMKWLHPDRRCDDWESTFAERVLAAWHDLGSPDRRTAYDRTRGRQAKGRIELPRRVGRQPIKRPRTRIPWIAVPRRQSSAWLSRPMQIAVLIVLVATAIVILSSPGWMANLIDEHANGASNSFERGGRVDSRMAISIEEIESMDGMGGGEARSQNE